jgi:Domain of unknown function (DUF6456)
MSKRRESDQPSFNDNENPLLRLYLRKGTKGENYIDGEQFAAGEKLRQDFERAMLAPKVTIAYQEPASSGSRHWQMSDNHVARLSDSTLTARDHVHDALDAVGPELAGILYTVICLASGLEQAERRLALPPRSGKAVLALALTRLARHYGLKRRPQSSAKSKWPAWQMAGARPNIMPPATPPSHPL